MQQGSKNPWFDFEELQKEAKDGVCLGSGVWSDPNFIWNMLKIDEKP